MSGNSRRQAYLFCPELDKKTTVKCLLEGLCIVFIFTIFFYRSVFAVPFLTPIFFIYYRERVKQYKYKRKKEVALQFKDAIVSVLSNLKAGYSVENSFRQSYPDMLSLHGKESIISKEIAVMIGGMNNNIVLEKLLHNFAKKYAAEEVEEFAEVFAAAKRNGGNMTEIMEKTTAIIEGKAETDKEIEIILSAKQMERKIMSVIPFGILLYVGMTSKGFFDVLYYNPAGIAIMTFCLLIYIAAVLLANKMIEIEI